MLLVVKAKVVEVAYLRWVGVSSIVCTDNTLCSAHPAQRGYSGERGSLLAPEVYHNCIVTSTHILFGVHM